MAQLWHKNDDGDWVPAAKYARDASGWRKGTKIYEKTGASTWTLRYNSDVTPPATPTLSLGYNATTKVLTATCTMPSTADTNYMFLKVSESTNYPLLPNRNTSATEGNYIPTVQADGYPWSERPVTPSQVVTRSTGVAPGKTYSWALWARDDSFNWSARAQAQMKIPVATTTTPATVIKSAYVNVTDSASWNAAENYWRTDNTYVYQGGENWYGAWFYGSQIRSLLIRAKRVVDMKITIQRVNTTHGISGEAQVYLTPHRLDSQPAGSPVASFPSSDFLVGGLNRGETKTFTVPSAMWPYFISGSNRGLGLAIGTTTYVDNRYLYAYGRGTTSGRLWIQWEE